MSDANFPVEKKPHVLLDGPYGKANLGDNAIAFCLTQFLLQNGVDVTISCIDPDYISKSMGVNAIPMLNFRRLESKILTKISNYDAVIIGGGQQLQEYTVPNPFIGMIARVCHMARAARNQNVPFIAWSVGMDWPLSNLANFMIRKYLGTANSTLILRDGQSFLNAKKLFHDKSCKVIQSKDPVFMISSLVKSRPISEYDKEYFSVSKNNKRLIVCPSLAPDCTSFLNQLVKICCEAALDGYEVLGWHSEIRPNYDLKVRDMAEWQSIPGFRWLPPDPINTEEVTELIGSASLVLTTRMHPAILAVSQGVASYGVALNRKMSSIFDELLMPYCKVMDIGNLTFKDLIDNDFAKSIELAASFCCEAADGGAAVLEIIQKNKQSLEI